MKLDDTAAIVTGSASGLGAATARVLAETRCDSVRH
jgi:NAD(P)-dependent dehydrogenase (short-subunit alcohol dehydrogenase family)